MRGVIMRLNLDQQIKCIVLGVDEEEYKKRLARLRRLTNEKFDLIDGIEVLEVNPTEEEKKWLDKKQKRLVKVEQMISELEKGLLI